jgi:hypothetical protein
MKKFMSVLLAVLLVFIEFSYVQTEKKPLLAVLPLKGLAMGEAEAIQITQFLHEELFYKGRYALVEQNQVNKTLKESQYQQTGICDIECAVNLGKQLAADKVIIGTVGKLENTYTIQTQLIDVQTGKVEVPASIQIECRLQELPNYIGQLAEKIVNPRGKTETTVKEEKPIEKPKAEVKEEEKPKAVSGKSEEAGQITKKKKFPWLIVAGVVLVVGVVVIYILTRPKYGIIQVNSTPAGAKIFRDGVDLGKTTPSALNDLAPGSYTIKLVKEGYRDSQQSVTVTKGKTVTINASLTPNIITVTSPSSGALWDKGFEAEITWTSDSSLNRESNYSPSFPLVQGDASRGQKFNQRPVNEEGAQVQGDINSAQEIEPIPVRRFDIEKNLAITYVNIDLYKGNNLVRAIVANQTNSGSYRWTPGSDLSDGSDYKVRISCTGELSVYGESPSFQIMHPHGSIAITSNPTGARAYLNGTDTGQTTNCTLTNVDVGTHTVKLTLTNYEDWQQSVQVTAHQTTNVTATLIKKTGSIAITSNPTGARAYLDGTDTGQTTNCTLTNVNVGTHTLKLTLASYEDWQQSVEVRWNETANVNATLTKKVGKLVITFSPNPVSRSSDGYWYCTLTAKETNGIGITLTNITMSEGTWNGGLLWSPPYFNANETKTAYLYFWGFTRTTTMTMSFYGTDDNGNSGVWTGNITLQYPSNQSFNINRPPGGGVIR